MTAPTLRLRRDGWTPDRQAVFIAARGAGASIGEAAQAAGMSRRAAYRLRAHPAGAAVAATWPMPVSADEFDARLDARIAAGTAQRERALADDPPDTRTLLRMLAKLGARV